jgi:hypothetical protein
MFAQLFQGGMHGWGIGEIAIMIVVIAAVVALVYVALNQFGVAIPPWVIQCFLDPCGGLRGHLLHPVTIEYVIASNRLSAYTLPRGTA